MARPAGSTQMRVADTSLTPALPLDTLVEGDCLDVLTVLPDASVGMILCDLPYGTTQNPWDCPIDLDRLWAQYERIIEPRGVIALTAQGLFSARLAMSRPDLFRYKIVWVKSKPTNFLNAKRQPLRRHEDVLIFYKKQPAYQPQMSEGSAYSKGVRKAQHTGSYGRFDPVLVASEGGRYPTDVVYFKTAESEGRVWHPTQKPMGLAHYLIRTFSKAGSLVVDNAFGSGTFPLAAALEGRRFFGVELNVGAELHRRSDLDLFEVAESRFAENHVAVDIRRKATRASRPRAAGQAVPHSLFHADGH